MARYLLILFMFVPLLMQAEQNILSSKVRFTKKISETDKKTWQKSFFHSLPQYKDLADIDNIAPDYDCSQPKQIIPVKIITAPPIVEPEIIKQPEKEPVHDETVIPQEPDVTAIPDIQAVPDIDNTPVKKSFVNKEIPDNDNAVIEKKPAEKEKEIEKKREQEKERDIEIQKKLRNRHKDSEVKDHKIIF